MFQYFFIFLSFFRFLTFHSPSFYHSFRIIFLLYSLHHAIPISAMALHTFVLSFVGSFCKLFVHIWCHCQIWNDDGGYQSPADSMTLMTVSAWQEAPGLGAAPGPGPGVPRILTVESPPPAPAQDKKVGHIYTYITYRPRLFICGRTRASGWS